MTFRGGVRNLLPRSDMLEFGEYRLLARSIGRRGRGQWPLVSLPFGWPTDWSKAAIPSNKRTQRRRGLGRCLDHDLPAWFAADLELREELADCAR